MSDPKTVPSISIVMATRNRAQRLSRALDAIDNQQLGVPAELIVVDDASTDETREILAARPEGPIPMRVEFRAISGGPAGARNTGLRFAQAPLVAFTDDDCEPSPDWLAAIIEAADGRDDVFVQGPTEPNPRERDRLGPFSRTLDVNRLGPWFPTCNIAYPRAALERLGGFDETLLRGEDTDLAYRAQEMGLRPRWAADALVWHAVMELGPIGKLRVAGAWGPAVQVFASHPGLRSELEAGVFWKRSHALLVLAAVGLLIARRLPLGAVLAAPYLWHFAAMTGGRLPAARWLPYHVLHDLTEMVALARGSVKARTLVL